MFVDVNFKKFTVFRTICKSHIFTKTFDYRITVTRTRQSYVTSQRLVPFHQQVVAVLVEPIVSSIRFHKNRLLNFSRFSNYFILSQIVWKFDTKIYTEHCSGALISNGGMKNIFLSEIDSKSIASPNGTIIFN